MTSNHCIGLLWDMDNSVFDHTINMIQTAIIVRQIMSLSGDKKLYEMSDSVSHVFLMAVFVQHCTMFRCCCVVSEPCALSAVTRMFILSFYSTAPLKFYGDLSHTGDMQPVRNHCMQIFYSKANCSTWFKWAVTVVYLCWFMVINTWQICI